MKTYTPLENEYECPECGGSIAKSDLNYEMSDSGPDWDCTWIEYREKCPHCGKAFRMYEVLQLTSIEVWRVDE